MKVKVCGMKNAGNIAAIVSLKPDYLGFIFHNPSPRNCIGMDPAITTSQPKDVEPVMVSVDMTEDGLLTTAQQYGFRTMQLHGNEAPEMCRRLRSKGFRIIKAIGMHSTESLKSLQLYEGAVDMFLLDTFTPSKGGSGKKFDWSILDAYDMNEPFMLSGGIGPEDGESILAIRHPKFEGIDLNSRFESSPGIKNVTLLKNFLSLIRSNCSPALPPTDQI